MFSAGFGLVNHLQIQGPVELAHIGTKSWDWRMTQNP